MIDGLMQFDGARWKADWTAYNANPKAHAKPDVYEYITVDEKRVCCIAKDAKKPVAATFWIWTNNHWRVHLNLLRFAQRWIKHELKRAGGGPTRDWKTIGTKICEDLIGDSEEREDFDDDQYKYENQLPVFCKTKTFIYSADGTYQEKGPDPKANNYWALACDPVFDQPTPIFDQMMQTYEFDEQTQRTIRQLIAYCCSPVNLNPQVGFLIGASGENGKSTFLELVKRLLGKKNTTAVSLENLNEQTIEKLANALANLPSENTKGTINEELLKAMAGGETKTCNPKYRDPYDIALRAKNIFAFNTLPISTDVSNAYWRRVLVIPFMKKIEKPDPFFLSKLVPEFPAILGRCLKEIPDMIKRGGMIFASPKVKAATDDYRNESSISLIWLNEVMTNEFERFCGGEHLESHPFVYCVPSPHDTTCVDVRVNLNAAYPHFKNWAEASGYRNLSLREWIARLTTQAQQDHRFRIYEDHRMKHVERMFRREKPAQEKRREGE